MLGVGVAILVAGGAFPPPYRLFADSLNMTWTGGWHRGPGYAIRVDTVRNLAFMSSGAELLVVDLSDTTSPAVVSRLTLPHGAIRGMDYDPGTQRLYVAAGDVAIVDVSQPTQPQVIGTFRSPGWARDVAVEGTWLYVADGDSGLRVVDITLPGQPAAVGVWTPSPRDAVVSVEAQGTYVYAGMSQIGCLDVIDVSTPSSPVQVAHPYSYNCGVLDLQIAGSYLYVATNGGLMVVDIQVPAAATVVGSWGAGATAYGVDVEDTLVVLSAGSGVHIVDVSDPTYPFRVSGVSMAGPRRLDRVGDWVYVASDGGLRVVHLEDPQRPVEVNRYTPWNARLYRLEDRDTLMWVGDWFGRVHSFSIARPPRMPVLQAYAFSTFPYNLKVYGPTLYVAHNTSWGSPSVHIVDVTDPAQMQFVGADSGGLAAGDWLHDLETMGTLLLVAAHPKELVVKDISNPMAPVTLAVMTGNSSLAPQALEMDVMGTYVYQIRCCNLSNSEKFFRIVDLQNPASPVEVYRDTLPGADPVEVLVDSPYLYLLTTQSLRVLDLSNPVAPVPVGSTQVTLPTSGDVEVDLWGGLLYIAALDSVFTVDVRNPHAPFVVNGYRNPFSLGYTDVVARGRFTYVAQRDSGIRVIANLDRIPGPPPHAAGSLSVPSAMVSVERSGTYGVGGFQGALRVFDLTNLAQPQEVARLDLGKWHVDLEVEGPYGYTASDSAVHVVNLTDPLNPVQETTLNLGPLVRHITIHQGVAYVSQWTNIQVLDLSQPHRPVRVRSVNLGDAVLSSSADSTFLFVGTNAGLIRLDIQNPTNPQFIDSIDVGAGLMQVAAIAPNLAAITTSDQMLRIVRFSLTFPGGSPGVIGSLTLPSLARRLLYVAPYLFIADGDGGLRAVDLSDPTQPQEVGYYVPEGPVEDLAQYGNHILVAMKDVGLGVVQVLFATDRAETGPEVRGPSLRLRLDYPARGIRVVLEGIPGNAPVRALLWDVLGRRVRAWRWRHRGEPFTLSLRSLPPGRYVLEVRAPGLRRKRSLVHIP